MMSPTPRLALIAAALTMVAAPAAQAQDALAATGDLRIAAVGQTRVVMVQGVLADPFVWEWTFLDEPAEAEEGPVDTVAISVMYDCTARTRRVLVMEAYNDGAYVTQAPLYQEPAPVTPGALDDGALEVVCEPETNSDGATFPTLAAARTAMDARRPSPVTGP